MTNPNLAKEYDGMKKIVYAFCCGAGGSLIGYWAKSLDTVIGCLLFTLGIILVVGSCIALSKETKNDKEEK